jgi:release factor glutamine methyltransferase
MPGVLEGGGGQARRGPAPRVTRALASGTVREALAASIAAFTSAGLQTPRLDADLLLAEATGRDRGALVADPDAGVEAAAARRFGGMVRRRLAREPVAYILGRKGFRGIDLAVDRRALIPRPETELLVEVAVELQPATVLDVGTGSGAVALAVAGELPEARVVATDTSAAALELARSNAARLGVSDRVRFEPGTLPGGRYDLLLANLPYVSEAEWGNLAPEIVNFEPREALVAGPTGLEAIVALLDALTRGATEADAVALEVGAGQAAKVVGLVRSAGFGEHRVIPDLAGIDRVVIAR